MQTDRLFVLLAGIGAIGFIYAWFLSDWGKRPVGKDEKKEDHGNH